MLRGCQSIEQAERHNIIPRAKLMGAFQARYLVS